MTRCYIECARRAPRGATKPVIRYFIENARGERLCWPVPAARELARFMARQTKVGARLVDEQGSEVVQFRWREGEVVEVERGAP